LLNILRIPFACTSSPSSMPMIECHLEFFSDYFMCLYYNPREN
jgi:hypothetical protein